MHMLLLSVEGFGVLTVRPFVPLQLAAARQLARHRRTAWQQESANGRANASERSVCTPPQTPQSSATAARSANTDRPQSTPKAARTERVDGVKGEEPEETKLEDVDQQPGEPEDVPMASPGVAFGTLRELAAERTAGISAVTKQRLQARRLPQVRRKERGAPPPQRAKQQQKQQQQQQQKQQQHLVDELRGLADLREAGFLSPADFREAKRRVLNNR